MAILAPRSEIETGGHIMRARRTAALARVTVGVIGIVLVAGWSPGEEQPWLAIAGFATIVLTAAVQVLAPRLALLTVEESLAAGAGVLIVGFGDGRVDAINLLWLVAVASGVLARGGRVHWLGRTVLLCGLLLPIVRDGGLSASYAAFVLGTIALLLTAGRLTGELNALLRQARQQADRAETLLLAGDIAQRVSERNGSASSADHATPELTEPERASARVALARLIEGDGLSMAVQPIVDITTGEIHAYEALARFGRSGDGPSPLHWLALADQLGGRPELERACLREALALFGSRPAGTSLSVNLSAPVLGEARTLELLAAAAERHGSLQGLIVEITEETLIAGYEQLREAVDPLLAHGAVLAVDDMGAGYSGLRQITAVRPAYLKLDRSLASGIDSDPDRAALVAALAGYARQVGGQLVVEGVETSAELQALRRTGVVLVQGYRLSRPAPPWPGIDAADARGAPDAGLMLTTRRRDAVEGHERASRAPAARHG